MKSAPGRVARPGRPQRLQAQRLGVEAGVDAALLVVLRGDGAALGGHRLGVVGQRATQLGRGLGRVAGVELHLVVQRLAFVAQFGDAVLGRLDDDLRLRQLFRAAGVVRGLVGVASDQRLVAALDVALTLAFERRLALARLMGLALGGGEGGRDDAADGAVAVELALFAVDAGRDGAVERQAPPVGVDAGVDAAGRRRAAALRQRARGAPQQGARRQRTPAPRRARGDGAAGVRGRGVHVVCSTPYRAR